MHIKVYYGLSKHCGIPQLAKKLNQILEQHIRTILPCLKAEINNHMLAVARELQTYGEVLESEAKRGEVLLNILRSYSEDFSAMVNGSSQEISTKELSGGARIHYIFQSIFVKTLEEVDPCEDLTDEDIQMAIQNATGPRNAVFVPEVPFEVLARRQISRLLDPCLQCLRFVYNELKKISCACESSELQRFPSLRRRLNEVVGKVLRDNIKPAERMIENLVEMEMDYINSSHPSFIGGNKATELAMEEMKTLQVDTGSERVPTSDKRQKSWILLPRSIVNSLPNQGNRPQQTNEKPVSAGGSSSKRIRTIFGSKASVGKRLRSEFPEENLQEEQKISSSIQLREPPSVLRRLEIAENGAVEIIVTKLLLKSYFDIVCKNMKDLVPKATMHFLVNHTKRSLHNIFIKELYGYNLFEEMLQENDEIVGKRRSAREMFHILQQAVEALDEVESDVASQSTDIDLTADNSAAEHNVEGVSTFISSA